MKTFADLMQDNANICTINTGIKKEYTDTLTKWYNMWWGTLTDTHMQLMDDGNYIITGSRIGKKFLQSGILYARVLSTAPNTVLPSTLNDLLLRNHLQAAMILHNGQPAVAVGRVDSENKSISIPPQQPYYGGAICANPCIGCAAPTVDYM